MASIKCHCAFINIFDAAKQSEQMKKKKEKFEAHSRGYDDTPYVQFYNDFNGLL